ncbi:putative Ser/Thr protein kinase [Arcanobacterium pluranimalium]|uniref:serine/threonine-protein kinase n=1 Tax=Arcanobacterium pluranimalium TaxID=108028 RepID=UPI001958F3F9|nr:serine/threonine-protein kinase [Arcanobacterium pluranimalium]MBM7824621.1 putative Ser/Thr protein kinase [Arcanobacterium pluranimalium]
MRQRTEIGGYRIVKRIGFGGMSSVYEAIDAGGARVALKLMHPAIAADPASRDRLRREVAMLRRVRGPYVAQVVDAEIDDDEVFIVTELIDGPTLEADVREQGRYENDDLLALGEELADALDSIHEAGVLHRDLKPSNVMIGPQGPVLIDFGIAQSGDDTRLTQTGSLAHTPGYCDPRVLRGGDPDAQADWWALAAVLAYAATGRPPFGKGQAAVVMHRVLTMPPDLDGVDAPLSFAFAAALDPDPQRRISFDELLSVVRDPANASLLGLHGGFAVAGAASALGDDDGGLGDDDASTVVAGSETEMVAYESGEEADDDGTVVFDDDAATVVSPYVADDDGVCDGSGAGDEFPCREDDRAGETAILTEIASENDLPGTTPATMIANVTPGVDSPMPTEVLAQVEPEYVPPTEMPPSIPPVAPTAVLPAATFNAYGAQERMMPSPQAGMVPNPYVAQAGAVAGAPSVQADASPNVQQMQAAILGAKPLPTFRIFLGIMWVAASLLAVKAPLMGIAVAVALFSVLDVVGAVRQKILWRRLRRGGPSGSDLSIAMLSLPFTVVGSVLRTIVTFALPAGVAFAYFRFAQHIYMQDVPRSILLGVLAGIFLVAWLRPFGSQVREGARVVLNGMTPSVGYRVFWIVFALIFAVCGAFIYNTAQSVSWWPVPHLHF